MRKLIVLVLAALLTSVGVAGATSKDQGRRLAGPFCIGKTTVSPPSGNVFRSQNAQ